jgi:hypothetical protein
MMMCCLIRSRWLDQRKIDCKFEYVQNDIMNSMMTLLTSSLLI